MVKISAAFLECSIDNLCYATYMYKVELRLQKVCLKPNFHVMKHEKPENGLISSSHHGVMHR